MSAMTHIYTGNGKGKTTAAIGLAMRFSGYGGDVIIIQFCKGSDTGEIYSLAKISNIKVLRNSRDYGFWNSMSEGDKAKIYEENNNNLKAGLLYVKNGNCDLLVLDEIISAYEHGAIEKELVDALLENKPLETELVLTGRNASQSFIDQADYVSEIKSVRHPFDHGIGARKGVEF